MFVKEKLIIEYPLRKKMECKFECYEIKKRIYVIFIERIINHSNIKKLFSEIEHATKYNFPKLKSLIIVGRTEEEFLKNDLLYFNGVDTYVVYYLENILNKEIYYNNQKVFWFSVDWKKIVDRFNMILMKDEMFYPRTLMSHEQIFPWEEFLERYLINHEEFMFKYNGKEYWLAFSDDKKGDIVAELNICENGIGCEWYEYKSPKELLKNARIDGFTIKELWNKFE